MRRFTPQNWVVVEHAAVQTRAPMIAKVSAIKDDLIEVHPYHWDGFRSKKTIWLPIGLVKRIGKPNFPLPENDYSHILVRL